MLLIFGNHRRARWHATYTKPGGPDVWLNAFLRASEAPASASAVGTIRLGTLDRYIRPRTDTFELAWDDGQVLYTLMLMPTEGAKLTEPQFRAIVSGLEWP